MNKVISSTDPLGGTTSYTYDQAGNLSTTTDANGNVTSYTYDTEGRMVSMTDGMGNTWSYEYDAEGNLTEEITMPMGSLLRRPIPLAA